MNNFFRALIAGYGAKKLGGGCFGTIIVFIIIWVALGQCSFSSREIPPPQTYPAKHRVYVPVHPIQRMAALNFEFRIFQAEQLHQQHFDHRCRPSKRASVPLISSSPVI
ncbi:MAG TPA: hypothetical protein VFT90_07410 [Chryseosolibacter sp.]|nr:hypothetical protein [Chryseosolibacter sp.]